MELKHLATCRTCGLIQRYPDKAPGFALHCARCGLQILADTTSRPRAVLAFSLTALLLYIPANLYPILSMHYLGRLTSSTIYDGVVRLAQQGMWPLAVIVLLASIVIPFFKLAALLYLVVQQKNRKGKRQRTRLLRFVELIGRWSMLDVFLLSLFVGIIKLGQMADVRAEMGSLFFAAVVVCTMLASSNFKTNMIWAEDHE